MQLNMITPKLAKLSVGTLSSGRRHFLGHSQLLHLKQEKKEIKSHY